MNILTIPLRNLRRKPLRSGLLLALFALGLTSVVALGYISREVGESLETKLLAYGANILVTPRTETLTVSYGGFRMGDMPMGERALDETETDAAIRSIELDERIAYVAPKLVAPVEIQGTLTGLVGVRWSDELGIKGYWGVDGRFPDGPEEILAGSRLADRLGLAQGDTLSLRGREYTLAGVLTPTGSDDDTVLFMDLAEAQSLLAQPGRVSFVEVAAICAGCPIDDIVAQIARAVPAAEVMALKNVVEQRMQSVRYVQGLVLAVSLVILAIACAMVGLAMLSSVNERTREIGILRSLGYSRGNVFAIVCCEAVLLGLAAGVLGYLGGFAAARTTLTMLDMQAGQAVWPHPGHLALTLLAAAVVAALSTLAPAWKAARIRPAVALAAL